MEVESEKSQSLWAWPRRYLHGPRKRLERIEATHMGRLSHSSRSRGIIRRLRNTLHGVSIPLN